MEERLRLEFNNWAKAGRGERMERGHRPTGEQAISRMNLQADSVVLDLGCGSGWATRLMAGYATSGRVVGIDISDEMIALARQTSSDYSNVDFQIGSAESLAFEDAHFTHVFSMESIYYYENMSDAICEVRRVLTPGGLFVAVVDLYMENKPSHQWIDQIKVPMHLLSIAEYHELFEDAGLVDVRDQRLLDPAPITNEYSSGSFSSREDYLEYRRAGSLMMTGRAAI
jgi:ubiquinone/menaquinone biosynthesis C-methylase UbiE